MFHPIKLAGVATSRALVLAILLASQPACAQWSTVSDHRESRIGPCVIALWTHPDVGTGTFFVLVDPVPGGKIPDDLEDFNRNSTGKRTPSGGCLHSPARQHPRAGRIQDCGPVRSRRVLAGAADRAKFAGGGEALSRVEATPPGYGRWDLLLYMLPFLAIALLWFIGIARHRSRKRKAKLQTA